MRGYLVCYYQETNTASLKLKVQQAKLNFSRGSQMRPCFYSYRQLRSDSCSNNAFVKVSAAATLKVTARPRAVKQTATNRQTSA